MSINSNTTPVRSTVGPYAAFFKVSRDNDPSYQYKPLVTHKYKVVNISREVLELLNRAASMLRGSVSKGNETRTAAQKEWSAVELYVRNIGVTIDSLNAMLAWVTNNCVRDLQKFLLATKHNSAGYDLRRCLIIDAMNESNTQILARVLLHAPIGLGNRRTIRLEAIRTQAARLGLVESLGLDHIANP